MFRRRVNSRWFNSLLRTSPRDGDGYATLDIRIATYLNPYQPADAEETVNQDKQKVVLVQWSSEEWERWKSRFKMVVESNWNNKLWLVPIESRSVVWNGARYPNIRCQLTIELMPQPEHAHMNCTVVRLRDDMEFSRSSMRLGGYRVNVDKKADGYLDHKDLDPRDDSAARGQIPVVHEVGHYLGLDHVNAAAARRNPDQYDGYGKGYQGSDVMGGGMRFDRWHASPWIHRIKLHLVDDSSGSLSSGRASNGTVKWRGSRFRPPPQFEATVLGQRGYFRRFPWGDPPDGGVPFPWPKGGS